MRKLTALILATLLCLSALSGCETTPATPDKTLSVTVLPIGAADSILLKTENTAVLIDCGTKDDADIILSTLRAQGVRKLDKLIVTHYDKDHIGAAADVLKAVDVVQVIQPPYTGNTGSNYDRYKAALPFADSVISPTETLRFSLGGVNYTVMPPTKSDYGKNTDNDVSLAVRAVHGQQRFLFAGDAEADRLLELMESGEDLAADFLKVPHHGRHNKRSTVFLGKVAPAHAVITCSDEEPAEQEVLQVLSQLGAAVYQTKTQGVTAVSDGTVLTVSVF